MKCSLTSMPSVFWYQRVAFQNMNCWHAASSLEKFRNSVRHSVPKSGVWQLIGTAHLFGVCLCVLLRKECQ